MYSLAFEQRKWPKKHDYLVEQFDPLNVRDVLGSISAYHADNRLPWNPPTHPHLTVVPRKRRPVRWYFLCPVCGRRCEDLYPTYLGDIRNLKCRICSNLIYASQRHGKRHPLRKTLTPRKRVSRQKSMARFQEIEAKHREKTRRLLQESQSEYPDYNFKAIRKFLEIAIGGITDMEIREDNSAIRPLPGFSQSETEELFEKVKATLMDLAQNAKSKKVREQARKGLRDRGLISEEPKTEPMDQKPKTLSPHSIQLTQEQIEYLKKVALEAGKDFGDL